jgi:hypothetical protein
MPKHATASAKAERIAALSAARGATAAGGANVGTVIAERDGPFADYSQGPPEEQPDPTHVIHPPRR